MAAEALLVHPSQGDTRSRERSGTVEVLHGLDAAEALWRRFEAEAVCTPYQRFDWASAFVAPQDRIVTAVLRDGRGEIAAMLPAICHRQFGLTVAGPIGGKNANFNLPLSTAGSALPVADVRRLLQDAGRQAGIDLFRFGDCPAAIDGEPNPLATGSRPNPSNAYKLTLEADAASLLAAVMGKEARKKLRKKETSFSKLGVVRYGRDTDVEAIDRLLGVFLRQKAARFAELGIANPFGEAENEAAIRQACLAGLDEGRPAVEVYGLYLDEVPVAVFGGAGDAARLCGMFISFEGSGEIARCSPGELLLAQIVREQCERGRRSFDLGVGEARYKRTFCRETEELFEFVLPVSLAGRLAASGVVAGTALKTRIKQDARAMRALAWLRRLRA